VRAVALVLLAAVGSTLLMVYAQSPMQTAVTATVAFVGVERVLRIICGRVAYLAECARDAWARTRCAKVGHDWDAWWGHEDAGGEVTTRYRRCNRCHKHQHEDGNFPELAERRS
jgi:hypothetical protein